MSVANMQSKQTSASREENALPKRNVNYETAIFVSKDRIVVKTTHFDFIVVLCRFDCADERMLFVVSLYNLVEIL